jgi:PP-loop superfamily ATP-utilizing enzyme
VVRVRHDQGAARVEVGPDEVARLADLWDDLELRLRSLGFERVAYDPQGYRRGGADLSHRES